MTIRGQRAETRDACPSVVEESALSPRFVFSHAPLANIKIRVNLRDRYRVSYRAVGDI